LPTPQKGIADDVAHNFFESPVEIDHALKLSAENEKSSAVPQKNRKFCGDIAKKIDIMRFFVEYALDKSA